MNLSDPNRIEDVISPYANVIYVEKNLDKRKMVSMHSTWWESVLWTLLENFICNFFVWIFAFHMNGDLGNKIKIYVLKYCVTFSLESSCLSIKINHQIMDESFVKYAPND